MPVPKHLQKKVKALAKASQPASPRSRSPASSKSPSQVAAAAAAAPRGSPNTPSSQTSGQASPTGYAHSTPPIAAGSASHHKPTDIGPGSIYGSLISGPETASPASRAAASSQETPVHGLSYGATTPSPSTSFYRRSHRGTQTRSKSAANAGLNDPRFRVMTVLFVSTGIVMLLAIAIALVLGKKLPVKSETCTTGACLALNTLFVKSADFSLNPCENFYKHVCSGWGSRTEGASVYDKHLSLFLDAVVEGSHPLAHIRLKTTAVNMAHLLKSCLDTVEGRMNEVDKFRVTLVRMGATWPAIPEAPDVFAMAAKVFETFRLSPLVRIRKAFHVGEEQRSRLLSIEQGDALSSWTRRRERFLQGDAYRRYYDSAVQLYNTESRSTVTFDDFFAIERKVALILVHGGRDNDTVSTFRTLHALDIYVDKKYVNRLQKLLTALLGLPATVTVRVRNLGYFKRFIKAIEDIGEQKLQLYMGWITLQAMWRVLGKEFSSLWYDFAASRFGLPRPYRADCLEFVESLMGWAAYEPFERENAGSPVQAAVRALVRGVSEALLREHEQGRWSDLLRQPPVTDADFRDMLYHNVRVTEVKLNEVFANVSSMGDSFFDNWIAIARTMLSATEEQLQEVQSEYMAGLRESDNYTLLDRHRKLIRVPPFFSMLPLFHADSIDATNYGSFGVLLGSAAAHLFIDRIRGEDNAVLTAELDRRLGCFLQGSSYRHHRDVLHRSVAVDLVLKAWKASTGYTAAQRLRNYTAAKAFFVAMCYLLCVPRRAPSEPLAQANCNEAVRNSDAFLKAFGCARSDPMHSMADCELFAKSDQ